MPRSGEGATARTCSAISSVRPIKARSRSGCSAISRAICVAVIRWRFSCAPLLLLSALENGHCLPFGRPLGAVLPVHADRLERPALCLGSHRGDEQERQDRESQEQRKG